MAKFCIGNTRLILVLHILWNNLSMVSTSLVKPTHLRQTQQEPNVFGPDIIVHQESGECVDIFLDMSADTGPALTVQCDGSPRERFYILQSTSNSRVFRFKGERSLKCLGIFESRDSDGTPVVLVSCDRADTEWEYDNKGRLRSVVTNLCMRRGKSLFEVTNMISQGECDNDETWFSNALPDEKPEKNIVETAPQVSASSTIKSGNLCLEFPVNVWNEGVAVESGRCDDTVSQRYEILQYENGSSQIRADHSGLCLGRASSNSPFIAQLPCFTDEEDMYWTIAETSTDYYKVSLARSGQCLSLISQRFFFFWNRKYVGLESCDAATSWTLSGLDFLNNKSTGKMWAGPYETPLISVAAVNLPDGRIAMWSAAFRDKFVNPNDQPRTYTGIFDPETGLTSQRLIENTAHDAFCPGISMLDDGSYLISGGTTDKKVTFFDPSTNTWSPGPDMNISRGYHSSATLADSSVFTVGGSWVYGLSPRGNKPGELWDPKTNTWTVLDGIPSEPLSTNDRLGPFRADNHMWLFLAPNGLIFHAGPSVQMHWIDPKNNTYRPSLIRGDDLDSMKGNAIMYDVGKLLKLGGSENYDATEANDRAFVIDLTGGETNVTVKRVGDLNYKRGYVNSVVLPTGEVVVVGGMGFVRVFSDRTAVFDAEIWNPKTGEFSLLPEPMTIPRTYHSTALLLRDGRVYVSGGGLCANCRENHFDVEILTPPYLLNDPVRPVIVNGPTTFLPGEMIEVTLDTDHPHTFSIVRFSSVTHSTNTDARRIPLEVSKQSGNTFHLAIPSNPNVVLFGHYFLFAMSSGGVPSIALTTFCERVGRRRRATLAPVSVCNFDDDCIGDNCCKMPEDPDTCHFHGCFLWDILADKKAGVLDVDEIGKYYFDGETDYSIRCEADAKHVVFSYDTEYYDTEHAQGRSWWMKGINNATGVAQAVDYLGSHCGRKEILVTGYAGHLPCFVRQYYLELQCTE